MTERTYNIEDNELYNNYEYLYSVLDHTLKKEKVKLLTNLNKPLFLIPSLDILSPFFCGIPLLNSSINFLFT